MQCNPHWPATTSSSRAAIAAHGGHLVKTTGDGAHAVFVTASDAVDAAVAFQASLAVRGMGVPEPAARADAAFTAARRSCVTTTTTARR